MKIEKIYAFPLILVGIISVCIVAVLVLSDDSGANIEVINDRDYYPAVKLAFQEAEDYIHVVIYGGGVYGEDSKVTSLFEELGNAVNRGVDVKIVFDENWNGIVDTAIYLKSLGVDVVFDSKETTTHSKIIVVDDKLVVVGSTNWSHHALALNHEANVLIRNEELAKEYDDYFEDIWDEQ